MAGLRVRDPVATSNRSRTDRPPRAASRVSVAPRLAVIADVITPIIAAIFGQPDFSSLAIDVGDAKITCGNLLNVVFSFVVVGFVLFLVVRA